MYIFMYIFSCYDVKDVHCSFSKNIHLHKMPCISGVGRAGGHPNHKKVIVRGML